jgi:hypothetical protein
MDNQKITKTWLTQEIKFFSWLIGVVAVGVWGVAMPFAQIKQDIALIKENHFVHIESLEKEQTRLSEVQTKQQEEIIALMKSIAKIEN